MYFIKIETTICTKCSREGTKYFEGILQVRNLNEEVIKFIKNDQLKYKSKGVHITKEVQADATGVNIDFYYTDKRYLKTIADKLMNTFGARVKYNAQLFSIDWETSKNLYRLNVLVDIPKYKKNDVIKLNGELFKIISLDEKIHATNMKTQTKTLLAHKDSYDVLKPIDVIIIKKFPEAEVLDPITYYQAHLNNPRENAEVNQTIKVVLDGYEAWEV